MTATQCCCGFRSAQIRYYLAVLDPDLELYWKSGFICKKYLNSWLRIRDPGSSQHWIRDDKNQIGDPGAGFRDKHFRSETLNKRYWYLYIFAVLRIHFHQIRIQASWWMRIRITAYGSPRVYRKSLRPPWKKTNIASKCYIMFSKSTGISKKGRNKCMYRKFRTLWDLA